MSSFLGTVPATVGRRIRRVSAAALIWIVGCGVPTAGGAGELDFIGKFSVVAVTPVDDTTATVTVRMRLWNRSTQPVANGVVLILDPLVGETYGSFAAIVALPTRANALVEETFRVPLDVALSWQRANDPRFQLAYLDGVDREQRARVVARRVAPGQER